MFDDYSATLPLLIVVILENMAVAWVYGTEKYVTHKEELGWGLGVLCWLTKRVLLIPVVNRENSYQQLMMTISTSSQSKNEEIG